MTKKLTPAQEDLMIRARRPGNVKRARIYDGHEHRVAGRLVTLGLVEWVEDPLSYWGWAIKLT